MTSFSTQTCPSCLTSMNIEQNPSSLKHSDALKLFRVSQAFSSSITREFQKETEKGMGSDTAEYTGTDILFLCNVSLLLDGHKAKRHTSRTLSNLHNPIFLSNMTAFFLGGGSNIYHVTLKRQDLMASSTKTL